jgi:hypothetical protein
MEITVGVWNVTFQNLAYIVPIMCDTELHNDTQNRNDSILFFQIPTGKQEFWAE